jgi:transmembrane sensor
MPTERISYLLKQYLDNTLAPAEVDELMKLMLERESSAEIQAHMEALINQSPAASNYREGDWDPLFQKIVGANIVPVVKMRARVVVAAAILLLLASGGWWFLHINNGRQSQSISQGTGIARDAAPGRNRAILTLANGATVDLDSAKEGYIGRQGSSRVMKFQGGQLAYEDAASQHGVAQYNVLTTPRGGQYQLLLPDGSKVWLNAASSIRYPTSFTGHERVVEVTGEAYFEIAKNPAMPFKVTVARGMQVEVLGTHFNIMAYEDESTINTTLLEGLVRVCRKGTTALVNPGEQAKLDNGGGLKVAPADTEEAVAWKDGLFKFNEASIDQVMRQLSRWYDVEVVYVNDPPKDLFRGEMYRNVNVSRILKVLEASGVHFTVEGKKILVRS